MKVKDLRAALEGLDGELIVWACTDTDRERVLVVSKCEVNLNICGGGDARSWYPGETWVWQESRKVVSSIKK